MHEGEITARQKVKDHNFATQVIQEAARLIGLFQIKD